MHPEHLAPGDKKSLSGDWADIELHVVEGRNDPLFDVAYGALWQEFGSSGEMERAEVLGRRMQRNPLVFEHGAALKYCLVLLRHHDEIVAVRDHTVILHEVEAGAVVHLSHNLTTPAWRRSGITGWMRALPVSMAYDFLKEHGRPADSPVTLIGEMEHLDSSNPATWVRLTAYEKAGFKMVNPKVVHYLQPDFRDPSVIDASGGPSPVPFCLMLRRVGRENDGRIAVKEIIRDVRALYKMYGMEFRPQDMQVVYDSLTAYPPEHDLIDLIPPTST
jgi:hypothetical protein